MSAMNTHTLVPYFVGLIFGGSIGFSIKALWLYGKGYADGHADGRASARNATLRELEDALIENRLPDMRQAGL